MQTTVTDYKITKSNITSYKIRKIGGHGWADISVDFGEESVRIQIASDYGHWQYYWGCCGVNPITFLKKIDIGYVANKFGCNKHFNADITVASIKREILLYRKQEDISAETARTYFDEIKEAEEVWGFHSPSDLYLALNDKDISSFFIDGYPIQMEIDPGFKRFWEELWPVFLDNLSN